MYHQRGVNVNNVLSNIKFKNNCKVSSMNNVFKGYYQNVRGLRTKLIELRYKIPLLDFDFFALTET